MGIKHRRYVTINEGGSNVYSVYRGSALYTRLGVYVCLDNLII